MNLEKSFTSGELAKLLNVSRVTLFQWEKQGLIPKAKRKNDLKHTRVWTENEAKEIYLYKETHRRIGNYGSCPLTHA